MDMFYNLYNATPKHKVFISFHNVDKYFKKHMEENWGDYTDGFISRSVGDGDIDPNLPDEIIREKIRDEFISKATVTIVLIGNGTWRRKHVDWEIGSSLRNTSKNPRTGLLGIVLPTYQTEQLYGYQNQSLSFTENGGFCYPFTIPPRLYDNVLCGYAKIYSWANDPQQVKKWIHEAYIRRDTNEPDQHRDWYRHNRGENQADWRNYE